MSQYRNYQTSNLSHVLTACEVLGVPNQNFVSAELDEIEGFPGTTCQLSVWDVARNHKCGFVRLRVDGDMRCGSGSEMWDRLGELFELIPPNSPNPPNSPKNGKIRSDNCETIERAVRLLTPKGSDYDEVQLESIHSGVKNHYQLSLMGKSGVPNKRVILEFSGGVNEVEELWEGLENARVMG